MGMSQIVELGRVTLQTALLLGAPILAVAMVVSVTVNVVQVMTSLQEPTLSTVPRLLAAGGAAVVLMPWVLRHAAAFAVRVLSDLPLYAR